MNNAALPMIHKQNQVFVRFAVCFLLMGLAYRFYFSSFFQIFPVVDTTDIDDLKLLPPVADPPAAVGIPVNHSKGSHNVSAKCDIFKGDWVADPTGPRYTNLSCNTIEHHQNCMKNGRPDSSYIYWKWSPRDCELPKFNPRRFLDLMRKKSMAFIGDSISRNHVQSLLCLLSQVEKAVEVYHDEEYRSKRWVFPSHDFTLSVIWSPFLTKAKIFEDSDGVSSGAVQLYLDELDSEWIEQFKNFDYIEIAGGKWFLKTAVYYENNTIVGCHNCHINNVTELGFDYAYRKALNSTLKFITGSDHKVYTFFRTTTPDHFENGEWNTGGYCNRTVPFKEGEIDLIDIDTIMRNIELEEFDKAKAVGIKRGSTLKLFDTTYLSLLRPDGHPGPYRAFHPFEGKDKNAKVQNDCLHWCLPGPIDSWNDLIMEMLLGSRRL